MSVRRAVLPIRVRGVVQGVGFRPFVFRLRARTRARRLGAQRRERRRDPPRRRRSRRSTRSCATCRTSRRRRDDRVDRRRTGDARAGSATSSSATSRRRERPTVRISPDLPRVRATACASCSIPATARTGYPYINCTNCGPRYSIVDGLPYDRARTTMALAAVRGVRAASTTIRAIGGSTRSRSRVPPADRTTALRRSADGASRGRRRDPIAAAASCCAAAASSRSRASAAITWRATRANAAAVAVAARAQVPQGDSRSR